MPGLDIAHTLRESRKLAAAAAGLSRSQDVGKHVSRAAVVLGRSCPIFNEQIRQQARKEEAAITRDEREKDDMFVLIARTFSPLPTHVLVCAFACTVCFNPN